MTIFDNATTMQLNKDKEGYYLVLREIMESNVIKRLTAYGYYIDFTNDIEDLKQAIALAFYEVMLKLDRVNVKLEDKKVPVPWYSETVSPKLLYVVIRGRITNKLRTSYFNKSINSTLSLQYANNESDAIIQESDLLTMIDSKLDSISTSLDYSKYETIQALQGALTKTQYQYLVGWFRDGSQPYRDGRLVTKIREKLTNSNLNREELIHALNGELEKQFGLLNKLGRI